MGEKKKLPWDFTVYPRGQEPEGHHPDYANLQRHATDLEVRYRAQVDLIQMLERKLDAYEVIIAALCAIIFGLTLYWIFL